METQRSAVTAAHKSRLADLDRQIMMVQRKAEVPFPRAVCNRSLQVIANANSLSKSEKKQLKELRRERRKTRRGIIGAKLIDGALKALKEFAKVDYYP